MRTTTEAAAEIRKRMKAERGWTGRQVSIRSDYYSGGSSIDAVVKDPTIHPDEVEVYLRDAERIHRCEYSGEILAGGNRYVHVRDSAEVMEHLGEKRADALGTAVRKLVEQKDNRLVELEPGVLLGIEGYDLTLWLDRDGGRCTRRMVKPDVTNRKHLVDVAYHLDRLLDPRSKRSH